MRKVKCFVTGEMGDAKDFYWNFVGGVKKYFKNEEVYRQYTKSKEDRANCTQLLAELIGLEYSPTINKEITGLHNTYGYDIILATVQDNKNTIEWSVANKLSEANEYQKARYVMAIIKNNIATVAKRWKKIAIQKEADVEIDVLNQTDFVVHVAKDISHFLEDE